MSGLLTDRNVDQITQSALRKFDDFSAVTM
jgi:hypothetical protein